MNAPAQPACFFRSCLAVAAAVILGGCTWGGQTMVNARGESHDCGRFGVGSTGIAISHATHDNCVRSLSALGWLPDAFAGQVGVRVLRESHASRLHISEVAPGSPAGRAGIAVGDELMSIDSEPVASADDALRRLFGPANTDVRVQIRNATGSVRYIVLQRKTGHDVAEISSAAPAATQ